MIRSLAATAFVAGLGMCQHTAEAPDTAMRAPIRISPVVEEARFVPLPNDDPFGYMEYPNPGAYARAKALKSSTEEERRCAAITVGWIDPATAARMPPCPTP